MPPLAYNTNLHPAERVAEIAEALAAFAGPLRERLGWERLGVDLRLGLAALAEDLAPLRRVLERHRLSAHTINGFPLRPFQAARVKEDAYRPDWSEPERLDASLRLLEAALALSDEPLLTISTCPGSFRPLGPTHDDPQQHARAYGLWAAAAWRARQRHGRRVVLCLEPEPWCTLESSWDAAWFWRGPLATSGLAAAAAALDGDTAAAQQAIAEHLALCLDTCHSAVIGEEPLAALARLRAAAVPIAKLQVTAAVVADLREPMQAAALAAMAEPRFLHQTTLFAADGSCLRLADLDGFAAARQRLPAAERAVSHFHVPIDRCELANGLATSADHAQAMLHAVLASGRPHLAVETYTWPLLSARVAEQLAGTARELATLACWCAQTG
ncbi:MAG: metabolite traffic protein EboE [Planctomycetota bacterium]|nr:metabolite traffic protein EboE [Planctomycetota bacterium]MCX8040523.1 metabolite traffic protein EboE [Planctomycetota bacterium]MDW8373284.1 metabolite traffic protein EboE [Planctomycetota bacterium]